MKKSRFLPFVALTLAFGLVGCGASKVQVTGRVEWADGKPAVELANGQVIFESAATRTSARGVIGKDGTFRIDTEMTQDGVLPGEYLVAIVEHRPAPEGTTTIPPQYLPDRYYTHSTSGLKATVVRGENAVTLKVDRLKK
jgi:hypothetical protein